MARAGRGGARSSMAQSVFARRIGSFPAGWLARERGGAGEKWRRRRDSNPRSPFGLAHLANECLQPLGHVSGAPCGAAQICPRAVAMASAGKGGPNRRPAARSRFELSRGNPRRRSSSAATLPPPDGSSSAAPDGRSPESPPTAAFPGFPAAYRGAAQGVALVQRLPRMRSRCPVLVSNVAKRGV